jgi:sortase A
MLRRSLRGLSTVLIVAGSLLLIDAALTLLWQEPISAIYADIQQQHLRSDLRTLEHEPPTAIELATLARLRDQELRIAYLAREYERRAKEGDPIGRIKIKRIGINFVVVQGTATDDLQKGPGHYPETAFPGLGQTVAIAGHRTTYLAPFRNIDSLRRGNRIVLQMPYATFTYAVQGHKIVNPDAIWVIRSHGYERLVLSACNPLFSAAQRIVVFARMISVVPRGSALSR